MPLYAYQCKDCGVRFERRQGFDDPAITVCPECEGAVHRLIQPAGVIFKGSGFYVTDNKGSSHNVASSSTKSEKSSSEKTTGETSKKSETKTSESKSEKSTAGAKSDA
jgi:putative FmdB family regulatory protein